MNNTFGNYLKQLRLNRDLSLKDVEHKLGLSASYLHRLETGSRTNPSVQVLKMLSSFYEVNCSELLEVTSENQIKQSIPSKKDIEFINDTVIQSLLSQLINRLLNLNSNIHNYL